MTSIKKSDRGWLSGRALIILSGAFCVLLAGAFLVMFQMYGSEISGMFDVSTIFRGRHTLDASVERGSAADSFHKLHPDHGVQAVAATRQYGDNPGITFDVCPEQQVMPVQQSSMGPIVLSDDCVLDGGVEWSCNVDELRAFQKEFPGEELPKEEYCFRKRVENKHEVFQSQPQSMDRQDFSNGFIGSFLQAYSGHHHVQLRPDDFWLAVVRGFDTLMLEGGPKGEGIAEEVRDSLVEHKGKVKLVVRSGGSIRTGDVDWIVEQFAQQIDKKTKSDVRNWIEPDFSTTTPLDRAVSKMALMSTMQRYFDYKAVFLCSLPRVTLLGTVEDWKLVRQKVDGLLRFDHELLTKWHGVLAKVVDQFQAAANGEIDAVFWQSVHDWRGRSKQDAPHCESGSCPIDGWVAAFAPLQALHGVQEKHPFGLVEPGDFPTGWFEVPVEVDDNGVQYQTWMRAGHFGENVSGDKREIISPAVGWQWINQTPRPRAEGTAGQA